VSARRFGFVTTSVVESTTPTWYDLEQFIVDGAKFSTIDSRLYTSYAVFIKTFIDILAPAKLKRVIVNSKISKKELKFLGHALELGAQTSLHKGQWKGLINFLYDEIKRTGEEPAFSIAPYIPEESFKKWKLLSSKLELDNKKKYLNMSMAIKAPQILRRVEGRKTVAADIVSFRDIMGKEKSLSELARLINQDYSTTYKVDKVLQLQLLH
tara:strand:- start:239 stop:871 length:633 start_codon:yes stop_codon:yes gene_type:complete